MSLLVEIMPAPYETKLLSSMVGGRVEAAGGVERAGTCIGWAEWRSGGRRVELGARSWGATSKPTPCQQAMSRDRHMRCPSSDRQ